MISDLLLACSTKGEVEDVDATFTLIESKYNPDVTLIPGCLSKSPLYGDVIASNSQFIAISSMYGVDTTATYRNGAVYVFNMSDRSLAYVVRNPTGGTAADVYGKSMAMSEQYLIVGAPEEDSPSSNSGMVYIYTVATGQLLYTLTNPNAYSEATNDFFGVSVAITDSIAIVGANAEDSASGLNSGVCYVFSMETGLLTNTITNPSGTPADDAFGFALSTDGTYTSVGVYAEDSVYGQNTGAIHVIDNATKSVIRTIPNPSTIYEGTPYVKFAYYVQSFNGKVLTSAPGYDTSGFTDRGRVFLFNAVTGALLRTIDTPNIYGTYGYDELGSAIAMNNKYIAATSYFDDKYVVYIFDIETGARLYTLPNPSTEASTFGYYLHFSSDYLIVTDRTKKYNTSSSIGISYFYSLKF